MVSYQKLLHKPEIRPTTVKLTAYNGSDIPVVGECIANIENSNENINLSFILTSSNSPPIIGLKASEKLNLVNRHVHLINNKAYKNFNYVKEYNDCFGDIGTLPKIHHITVDPNITPVIHAARKVPLALQGKLKAELDRMINLNVIESVTGPSEWVSSLVVVERPDGKLRICMDPKDLNKAIKRHHLRLPTAEDIFSEMSGARYFTTLKKLKKENYLYLRKKIDPRRV